MVSKISEKFPLPNTISVLASVDEFTRPKRDKRPAAECTKRRAQAVAVSSRKRTTWDKFTSEPGGSRSGAGGVGSMAASSVCTGRK